MSARRLVHQGCASLRPEYDLAPVAAKPGDLIAVAEPYRPRLARRVVAVLGCAAERGQWRGWRPVETTEIDDDGHWIVDRRVRSQAHREHRELRRQGSRRFKIPRGKRKGEEDGTPNRM